MALVLFCRTIVDISKQLVRLGRDSADMTATIDPIRSLMGPATSEPGKRIPADGSSGDPPAGTAFDIILGDQEIAPPDAEAGLAMAMAALTAIASGKDPSPDQLSALSAALGDRDLPNAPKAEAVLARLGVPMVDQAVSAPDGRAPVGGMADLEAALSDVFTPRPDGGSADLRIGSDTPISAIRDVIGRLPAGQTPVQPAVQAAAQQIAQPLVGASPETGGDLPQATDRAQASSNALPAQPSKPEAPLGVTEQMAQRQVAAPQVAPPVTGARAEPAVLKPTAEFAPAPVRPIDSRTPPPPTPAGTPSETIAKAASGLAAPADTASPASGSENRPLIPIEGERPSAPGMPAQVLRPAWVPIANPLPPLLLPPAELVAQVSAQLGSKAGTEITIKLSPAELGLVRIGLTVAESQVIAVVSSERPEVDAMMRRHANELAQALGEAGYENVDLSFAAFGGGNGGAPDPDFDPDHATPTPHSAGAATSATAAPTLVTLKGGLDIRL